MAWRSSGNSNLQLISNMKSNGLIKSERIMAVSKRKWLFNMIIYQNYQQAMNAVDRANYVHHGVAYLDEPQ